MAEFKPVSEAEREKRRRKTNSAFRATSASFDAVNRQVLVQLDNGASAGFPIAKIRGLESATEEDLRVIEVQGRGFGLHVPAIDADFSVANLFSELLGSSVIAQAERRMIASRSNGQQGGRPKASPAASSSRVGRG